MNQTAPTGCNSTFRCTTGETNPKINTTTDPEKGQSRLVIAGVTNTIMAFIIAPQKMVSGKRCQTRSSFLIQKVGADAQVLGPCLVTMLPRATSTLMQKIRSSYLRVTSSTPWQEHSVIFRVSSLTIGKMFVSQAVNPIRTITVQRTPNVLELRNICVTDHGMGEQNQGKKPTRAENQPFNTQLTGDTEFRNYPQAIYVLVLRG